MSSPSSDGILQQMVSERDAFADFARQRLSQLDAAINARKEALEGFGSFALGGVDDSASADTASSGVSEGFEGLAYPAVVHKVLSLQPRREPMTVNQILDAMELHGVVPESQSPRNTVITALRRRSTKLGDIIHTGMGEWGLREWYSESEAQKFERAVDGANARDAKMHKENMKKGIAQTQARGAHYGKPPKITEEMWLLATRLVADEGRKIPEVYEEICKLFERDGEEPIGLQSLANRRKDFLARRPYPSSWKTYFANRDRLLDAKSGPEDKPKLRAVE
ncbi:hypothetical protein [Yoonia sp. BS5-3]|uniref:HTH HARE-type domain-containing protein n=1 Tax=Yoonia phaeophyticola TaxID=3137369 RepID=A0ABZ2VB74_9RHOB